MNKSEMIENMIKMQCALNEEQCSKNWTEEGHPWLRYVWTECAELIGHYGFKHWNKKEPDIDQCKLELVDIFHFWLSHLIVEIGQIKMIQNIVIHQMNVPDDELISSMSFHECVELLAYAALGTDVDDEDGLFDKHFDGYVFLSCMHQIGIDFDDLYKLYTAKNALNEFRNNHGYKENKYNKNWYGGEEDNRLLIVLSNNIELNENFRNSVYDSLESHWEKENTKTYY